MTQDSVKIVQFIGWLLKGQSHFLQLKNISIKTLKAKGPV